MSNDTTQPPRLNAQKGSIGSSGPSDSQNDLKQPMLIRKDQPSSKEDEAEDTYVLVKTGSKPALQRAVYSAAKAQDTSVAPTKAVGASVKNVMKGAKRSGNTLSVRAKLASASLFTSGANATQFPVVGIIPSSYTDFGYFQNVYDEYRVLNVEIFASVTPSASPTTLGRAWGCAFDPGNAGAYSIIYDTLSAQKCIGPIGIASVIMSDAKSGLFHTFNSGKLLPILTAGAGTVAPLAGGSWCATSDNSMICGYVKGAVDAIGATLTTTMAIWTVLHCEFRMRT